MKKRMLAAVMAILFLIPGLCLNVQAEDTAVKEDSVEAHLSKIAEWNEEIRTLQAAYDPHQTSDTAAERNAQFVKLCEERLTSVQAFVLKDVEESAQLRIDLIQYDIALQRLKQKTAHYQAAVKELEQVEENFRVGAATSADRIDAETARNKAKTELLAILHEIKDRKDKLTKMMGEPPADDYDYQSLYYTIDPSGITLDNLPQITTPDAICSIAKPKGAELEITNQADSLRGIKDLYFTLGGYLEDMVAATKKLETAKNDYKIGAVTQEQLAIAQRVYDDTRMALSVASAEYCKTLIRMDASLGGVFIQPPAVGGKEAYLDTLSEDLLGEGFWQITKTKQGKEFLSYSLPEAVKDCDAYAIVYHETELGRAKVGEVCLLAAAEYDAKSPQAKVIFYREEKEVISYALDVFSSMGTYTELQEE